jgi:NAD(P)-dependent dehydrogenase (short-subunit alcohol dehydrogenase family)
VARVASALEGRVVAVAGAAGTLGPSVVRTLSDAGATVALAGRRLAELEALAAKLDGETDTAAVDFLDAVSTREWADGLAADRGHVEGLVHLVGGWWPSPPIEEAPLADWERFHDLLIRTYQHTTQAFAPHLLASGRGRVVLVSPAQAQAPTSRNASYAAAKAAAEAWTLALADRFRTTGSTANVVVVGTIVTPATRAETSGGDAPKGTPAEEIAEAIAYLCSDAAASMNGQRLTLRGAG